MLQQSREKLPVMAINNNLEANIYLIGKEIFKKVKESKQSFFDISFWSSKLMALAMKNEKVKIQLFRFVDVLPALKTDNEISKHIQEYFSSLEGEYYGILQLATKLGTGNILTKSITSNLLRQSILQMAKNFISGENIKEVIQKIHELRKKNMTFTVDILGEAVLSEKEAEHYQKLYLNLISELSDDSINWTHNSLLDTTSYGVLPKVNVSVKPSSLYSQLDPVDFQNSILKLKDKLRPIFQLAKSKNVFINLDMEDYQLKDITLTVFKEILEEEEFKKWNDVGVVIQAYLKDSEGDLLSLIDWVQKRGVPVSVRLVKGAYWDYETIISRQQNWESRVFESKNETDANFEKLTKILIDNYPTIYTQIASHNIRSLAFSKAYCEEKNLPKGALEYQFLFGMADPIKEAFVNLGERVRVYTPYGDLIPGMAYLVRRLLENTANESFLRQGFHEGINEDELLRVPKERELRVSSSEPLVFHNEPDTDFTICQNRKLMDQAIKNTRKDLGKKYPLIINGKRFDTQNWGDSINPSNKKEIVGKFALAEIIHADEAVRSAKEVFENWSNTPVNKRSEILFNAARIMHQKRFEFASIIILEEGKPWQEADGDVSEAIDFLNYYAFEAVKLFTLEKLPSPSGEENFSLYKPKGVSVIISPWNFPLAILTGMSSASLVSGNTVILKPAKQASVIAYKYMEILEQAGLPPGVCNYLPGDGKVIGNYLVKHPEISLIAFTGSMEVGLSINKLASEVYENQNFVKKVICEMGGKNAIIIDNDADLDEAVSGVLYSAFGYSGQKCSACSRVIVLKDVYDRFLERFVNATKSIKTGPSDVPSSFLGPLIDQNALDTAKRYIEIGKNEGKLLTGGEILNNDGYFLLPTIFSDVLPDAKIAQEEIFAPVLSVIKANDINDAINIANGVRYALTGGFFSRSPHNIQKVKNEFIVGNLYINRGCTGAKVARQPFGGFKMSGIGSKAGGKDYLLQFVEPRVITENTMRRGFAPD